MIKSFNKVLVLAPHTDDGEFGCGGFISKLAREGADIYYIAFSSCEESVPKEFPNDILVQECKLATKKLGIPEKNLNVLEYKVRNFPRDRQNILEDLIKFKKKIKPDLVLIPSVNDIHQDHQTVAQEAVRAFKSKSIFSYELPWNNIDFNNALFVELNETDLQNKIASIAQYKSQIFRSYSDPEFIKGVARLRGVQVGLEYAEVFEVVRLII